MTRWYRKPFNSLIFNPWESHGPKIYKINLILTMINRLKIICSNESLINRLWILMQQKPKKYAMHFCS